MFGALAAIATSAFTATVAFASAYLVDIFDHGSVAPMGALVGLFAGHGVTLSIEPARGPMGLPKWDHIKPCCNCPRWQRSGKPCVAAPPRQPSVAPGNFSPCRWPCAPRWPSRCDW